MAEKAKTKRNIVFVHPDLGIGGAERLVIDAAVGLQNAGHKVTILTSYRDTNHCFEEARDGTLDVRVRGDTLCPPTLFGRLAILCAILRQLHLVLITALFSSELAQLAPDVIFVDQLSICIPFFRVLYPKAKVLFYGHYPDRLLAQEGNNAGERLLKWFYRVPFDALEGWSTGCADSVVVNSKFTRAVFKRTFRSMRMRELKVVYPCVDTDQEQKEKQSNEPLWPDRKVLLSINRFERKKNLDLAINAYAGLSPEERSQSLLVIAGGYDPRSNENAAYHKELQHLADFLKIPHSTFRGADFTPTAVPKETSILFLLSIPNPLKTSLLHTSSLLIYTPTNEHFGIVPIEAMLARLPVLATNTGGPLETIYDGRTGWLRSPAEPKIIPDWTPILRKPLIPSSQASLREMGEAGRQRVLAEFSLHTLTRELDTEISRLCEGKTGLGRDGNARPEVLPDWFQAMAVVLTLSGLAGALVAGLMVWLAGKDRKMGPGAAGDVRRAMYG
ncbi:mannosyltransferase [Hortaea werneckii]|nr:mannosyltransferase [Hortaea werneckii]